MTKSLTIFVGLFLAAHPVLAKDKAKPKNDDPAAASPAAAGSTSEQLRRGKRFMAALELLGVQTQMGMGSGVRGGYYLGPDSIITVQAAFGQAKFDSDTFSSSDYSEGSYDAQRTGKAQLFESRFQHFATNSFYWSAGAGLRQSEADLEAYRFLSEDERSTVASAKTSDIGLSGTIGNQWQWDTFMMGCDWVGFYLPVIHLSQTKSEKNTPTDETDKASVNRLRKKFFNEEKDGNAQGVRFYLGASF